MPGNYTPKTAGHLESEIIFHGYHLPLGQDCAGVKLPFELGGHPLHALTPKFISSAPPGRMLAATEEGTDIHINWFAEDHWSGQACATTGGKIDYFVHPSLIAQSDKVLCYQDAAELKGELTDWRFKFIRWLEVVTLRSLVNEDTDNTRNFVPIEKAYLIDNDKPHRVVSPESKYEAHVTRLKITQHKGITRSELESALRHSVMSPDGSESNTERTMLISAKRHASIGNSRESILNAATSFESALAHLLRQKLSGMGNKYAEVAMKNLTIMRLHEHLEALGIRNLPQKSDAQKVSGPRNRAIHEGIDPKAKEVNDAINITSNLVASHLPLLCS